MGVMPKINTLEHRTGGVNIDGSRPEMDEMCISLSRMEIGWNKQPDLDPEVQITIHHTRENINGIIFDDAPHEALSFLIEDRADLNRLIRDLRKARDSAFGRDE